MSVVFSFSKLLEQKEQLEQKHLHLLQILDTERQSKWQYVQQTEELAAEVRKLKSEVVYVKIIIRLLGLRHRQQIQVVLLVR